jgi:hypothetical protein
MRGTAGSPADFVGGVPVPRMTVSPLRREMAQLDQINHIVVLMLENRSFDSMLGMLYPASARFDGLTGTESNLDANGIPVPVWNCPGTDRAALSIPDPDPGELWEDINTQLFGTPTVPNPAPAPTMGGFVRNYLSQAMKAPGNYDAKAVMLISARSRFPSSASSLDSSRSVIAGLPPRPARPGQTAFLFTRAPRTDTRTTIRRAFPTRWIPCSISLNAPA